jgi:hypothetical protein
MFNELDVVVVRELLTGHRHVDGTAGVVRQPYLGDIGTVVHVHDSKNFIVECIDSDSGYTLWLAEFHADELVCPPSAWTFRLSEVSPGAYMATGVGPRGMHAESKDSDPVRATANCRAFAIRYPI